MTCIYDREKMLFFKRFLHSLCVIFVICDLCFFCFFLL